MKNQQLLFALKAIGIFLVWVIGLLVLPFKVIQIIEWSIGINNIMYWAFVPVLVWLLCIFLCCALTTAIVGDDL